MINDARNAFLNSSPLDMAVEEKSTSAIYLSIAPKITNLAESRYYAASN